MFDFLRFHVWVNWKRLLLCISLAITMSKNKQIVSKKNVQPNCFSGLNSICNGCLWRIRFAMVEINRNNPNLIWSLCCSFLCLFGWLYFWLVILMTDDAVEWTFNLTNYYAKLANTTKSINFNVGNYFQCFYERNRTNWHQMQQMMLADVSKFNYYVNITLNLCVKGWRHKFWLLYWNINM